MHEAKQARDLSVEDLRDVFSVSYEMAGGTAVLGAVLRYLCSVVK